MWTYVFGFSSSSNLLLPAGVPLERQRAGYRVILHRAEDLPRMDSGIMATMKKAMLMNKADFIDAYVRVSFVGHTVEQLSKIFNIHSISYGRIL